MSITATPTRGTPIKETSSSRTRRFLLGVGVVAFGIGLGGFPGAAAAPRPEVGGQSASTSADDADVVGAHPDVSDDGEWVVYDGPPTDESGRASTVWMRNTSAAETPEVFDDAPVELTQMADGVRPGESVHPSISGDGCYAVVVTEIAYDFFRDDDEDQRWDIYRLRLPHCQGEPGDWELVSTDATPGAENSALDRATPTEAAAVSETGAVIAFTQQAQQGQAQPGNDPLVSISVVDLTVPVGEPGRVATAAGTPTAVPDTTFAHVGQHEPSISADGRFVAFTSDARADLPEPIWGVGPVAGGFATSQVYVWDRSEDDAARAVDLVSGVPSAPTDNGRPTAGDAGLAGTTQPEATGPAATATSIAFVPNDPGVAFGSGIAFLPAGAPGSAAAPTGVGGVAGADGGDASGAADGSVTPSTQNTVPATGRLRDSTGTEPGDRSAATPVISGSGQYVAFASPSTDLVSGVDLPPCVDVCPTQIYRYDITTGKIDLVSRQNTTEDGAAGAAANAGGSQPTIDRQGSQVGFITRSTNLFPTETTLGAVSTDGELVVATLDLGLLSRVSMLPDGVTPAAGTNAHPVLSASGAVIVFDSLSARDLVGMQAGGRQVVSLRRPAQVAIADIDLGTVIVGRPGPEWWVGVHNLGSSTFLPSIVTSSNPDFAITGGSCTLGIPVLPGQFCKVTLVLTPHAAGPVTGAIVVAEAGSSGISVAAQVSGQGGEPLLDASPAGAQLAGTVVGDQSAPTSFDITNVGFAVGTIIRFDVSGVDLDDFTVVSTSCLGQPMIPGAMCSLEVAFNPTAAGYRSATVLAVADTGQYTSVVVNGTGRYEPAVQVVTDSIVAGEGIGVGGDGFAPESDVAISWADGAGSSRTVRTNSEGGFIVVFDTTRTERPGERELVVQGSDGTFTHVVRVQRRATPAGPSSPIWGG